MKTVLYSDAHVEVARQLFPERFEQPGWLDRQWTNEELEVCEVSEFRQFIGNPSVETVTWELYAADDPSLELQTIGMVDRYLKSHPETKSVLSVGCGGGGKEIWLAMRHPSVEIVAIDNAPYVEGLNRVVAEKGISNVQFRKLDLRQANLGRFGVVYSNAVIYCIPDEFLTSYFEVLADHAESNGPIFIGSAANISLLQRMRALFRKKAHKGYKQTGWMRDWGEVKRYIPETLEVIRLQYFNHDGQIPLRKKMPVITKLIARFSEHVYPVSSACFAFQLRKRQ